MPDKNSRADAAVPSAKLLPAFRIPCRFVDREIAVARNIVERLHNTAGPADLNALDSRVLSKTEVRAGIARRKIACRSRYRLPLRTGGGHDFDHCADPIAVAFVADQMNADPMVPGFRLIHQNVEWTIIFRDHGIHATIVIDVAYGHPPPNPALLKDWPGNSGDIDEFFPSMLRATMRCSL